MTTTITWGDYWQHKKYPDVANGLIHGQCRATPDAILLWERNKLEVYKNLIFLSFGGKGDYLRYILNDLPLMKELHISLDAGTFDMALCDYMLTQMPHLECVKFQHMRIEAEEGFAQLSSSYRSLPFEVVFENVTVGSQAQVELLCRTFGGK